MKKIFFVFVCLLLLCSLALPAFAAGEAPKILLQPQNYHYSEYSTAIYTVKATGSNLSATWYLEYEGKTYDISDMTNGIEPWEGYAGETYGPNEPEKGVFTYFFGGIGAELSGAEIWCVIEDGHYDVTSTRAIITVQGEKTPPTILEMPVRLDVRQGEEAELRCVANSVSDAQLSFQWYETSTGKLQDLQAMEDETGDFLFCSTEKIGTRYFVCCVTAEDGGMAYSSIVPVTVEKAPSTEPENTTPTTAPTAAPTTAPTTAPETVPETTGTAPETVPAATQPADKPPVASDASADFPWWGILLIALGGIGVGVGVALLITKQKEQA